MLSGCLNLQLPHLFDDVHMYIYKEIFPKQSGWEDAHIAVELHQQLNVHAPQGTLLPILSCGAAGGDFQQPLPLAAAWILYDIASDIFDDIQDGDGKERPWNIWSSIRAMNVAVQLLGGAQQCLSHLDGVIGARQAIVEQCGTVLKQAARDQNMIFSSSLGQQNLENYLQQIMTKSGEIFACIAQSGVRLHTSDQRALAAMHVYGQSLGILVQLLDDCRDLSPKSLRSDLNNDNYTLPILYCLSQTNHPLYRKLADLLNDSSSLSDIDVENVCNVVTEMGGFTHALYLVHSYRSKAKQALEIFPQGACRTLLEQYVTSFDFFSSTPLTLAIN